MSTPITPTPRSLYAPTHFTSATQAPAPQPAPDSKPEWQRFRNMVVDGRFESWRCLSRDELTNLCNWLATSPPGLTTLRLLNGTIGDAGAASLAQALEVNSTLVTLDVSYNQPGAAGTESLAQMLKVNSTLASLTVCQSEIGADGAASLAQALKVNSTLVTLNLNDNVIGPDGAASLAQALKVNSTLVTLNLNNNVIGHLGAASLAQALKVNSTLVALYVTDNQIDDAGAASLAQALEVNSTLATLDACANEIGDVGAASLANALKVNSTLVTLNVSYNFIGNAGAASLANALKVNSTLVTLYVTDNQIGDVGAASLAQALEVNSTLVTLYVTDNEFGRAGIESLTQALSVNATLTKLEYDDDNGNEDLDANLSAQLDKALARNRQLSRNLPLAAVGLELASALEYPPEIMTVITQQFLLLPPNRMAEAFTTLEQLKDAVSVPDSNPEWQVFRDLLVKGGMGFREEFSQDEIATLFRLAASPTGLTSPGQYKSFIDDNDIELLSRANNFISTLNVKVTLDTPDISTNQIRPDDIEFPMLDDLFTLDTLDVRSSQIRYASIESPMRDDNFDAISRDNLDMPLERNHQLLDTSPLATVGLELASALRYPPEIMTIITQQFLVLPPNRMAEAFSTLEQLKDSVTAPQSKPAANGVVAPGILPDPPQPFSGPQGIKRSWDQAFKKSD